jgi:hypothetical protein
MKNQTCRNKHCQDPTHGTRYCRACRSMMTKGAGSGVAVITTLFGLIAAAIKLYFKLSGKI